MRENGVHAPAYDSRAYWEGRFARVAKDYGCDHHNACSDSCSGKSRVSDTSHKKQTAAADGRSQDAIEWLGHGEVLLEPLLQRLHDKANDKASPGAPSPQKLSLPRILHLGAGVSNLGLLAAEACLQYGGGSDNNSLASTPEPSSFTVHNVDFAPSALAIGLRRAQEHARERGFGSGESDSSVAYLNRFCCADLRKWASLATVFQQDQKASDARNYDVVFDKSTSDSLATAGGVEIEMTKDGALTVFALNECDSDGARTMISTSRDENDICPLLPSAFADAISSRVGKFGDERVVHRTSTLDLVALHIAALTQPGTIWAALSFSAQRFNDVLLCADGAEGSEQREPLSRRYWHLDETRSIAAPSGSDNPYAPVVMHHVYFLRRLETSHTSVS